MTTAETASRFRFKRLIPLFILIALLVVFFSLGLQQYFTYSALQQYSALLQQWTQQHTALVVASYVALYILIVAVSLPGATIMTLAGGFLFGIVWGTLLVVISATLGACIIFLAAKTALADWLSAKAGRWMQQMEAGFRANALSYLLVLRFIPLFPFWLVNIVPALLNVPLRTFVIATFVGIIPGSAVYVSVGNGLSAVLATSAQPDLSLIFKPEILIPLIALAVLSLVPVIYRKLKAKHTSEQ